MRAVVQRVRDASVCVDGKEIARIDSGLLVLAAFAAADNEDSLSWMARKIPSLRVFNDDSGKMNLDLETVGGDILVVSQFTLYGDCSKGKRPSFVGSAPPDRGAELYERFVELLRGETQSKVVTGSFQAHMQVGFTNDGPVTLILERENH